MAKRFLAVVCALFVLAACASSHPAEKAKPVIDPASGVACADAVAEAFASPAKAEADVDSCLEDLSRQEVGADLQAFIANATPFPAGSFQHGAYYGHATSGDGYDVVVYRLTGSNDAAACLGLFMDQGKVIYVAWRATSTGLCG